MSLDDFPDVSALRSARFRAEREADWRRLDDLVRKTEARGVRSLTFEEAQDLAGLYRQTAHALSVARDISLDRSLLVYLEALVARAYLAVYAPPGTLSGLVGRFLASGAPRAVRRLAWFAALAALALFLGGWAGWALFAEDPGWYDLLAPPGSSEVRTPDASTEALLGVIYEESPPALDQLGAFASYLFSHNTRIAIFAFGLGALAGFPAFLLLFYNGIIIGLFVALHFDRGIGLDVVAWLSIHGVTELSAIILAGAAGMALGSAVLFPGMQTRGAALRAMGPHAVKVALVAGLMLLVAAILEGFFRQTVQSLETRLLIGWGAGALWLTWFVLGGRRA